jgi:hypothetical protein
MPDFDAYVAFPVHLPPICARSAGWATILAAVKDAISPAVSDKFQTDEPPQKVAHQKISQQIC